MQRLDENQLPSATTHMQTRWQLLTRSRSLTAHLHNERTTHECMSTMDNLARTTHARNAAEQSMSKE